MISVGTEIRVATWIILFFFQAEDGIRDATVTGVQTCALPICGDFHSFFAHDVLPCPARAHQAPRMTRLFAPALRTACGKARPCRRRCRRCPPPRSRSEERRVGEGGRCRGARAAEAGVWGGVWR